jgi:ketosteroid isomerase-like protein
MNNPGNTKVLQQRGAFVVIGMLVLTATASAQVAAGRPGAPSVESRLERAEDLLAIQQLLGDYMTYMDATDYASYAGLFAADGELIFQKNRLQGPKAIRELMEQGRRNAGAGTSGTAAGGLRHMMSHPLIRVDGNRATSTAQWIVMSRGADGRPVLGATGHYEDQLRKDGTQWKFQRRVIYTDFPYDNPLEAK